MTASYIALALAYLDFLADGLKVKKKGIRKVMLCIAVFVPPTLWLSPTLIFLSQLLATQGALAALSYSAFSPGHGLGRKVHQEGNPQPSVARREAVPSCLGDLCAHRARSSD